MLTGAQPATYFVNHADAWRRVDGAVIEEAALCIYVNGQELATLMCSPVDREALAVGFLHTEGLLHSRDQIELVELSQQGACVDVWLTGPVTLPHRAIRTSGCSGGITFDDLAAVHPALPLGRTFTLQQIVDRHADLNRRTTLYPAARGVHAAALCTPDALLLWAEDIGRHNTVDKLAGKALLDGVDTRDCLIVTTGRISSEMLGKAAKLGVSVIASYTSPTSRTLALAQAWNVTVVGYLRRDSLRLYTVPERIVHPASRF